YVVHDQRASRYQSRISPEQLGRHQVSTAASGKSVDGLRVRRGDDEHSQRHQQRKENREVLMRSQREKSFLGTVTGGAKPVRSETHPRQERDQRQTVKQLRVAEIARRAN